MQIIHAGRAICRQQFAKLTRVGQLPARPVSNNNMGKIQYFIPAMPTRQAEIRVHTGYQTQRHVRVFLSNGSKCVNSVRGTVTPELAIVNNETGLIGHCDLHHAVSQPGRRECAVSVWRIGTRHKPDLTEAQRLQ